MNQVPDFLLFDKNEYTHGILRVWNSSQYIYVTGLCNIFFAHQDLIDRTNLQRIAFPRNLLLIGSYSTSKKFFR